MKKITENPIVSIPFEYLSLDTTDNLVYNEGQNSARWLIGDGEYNIEYSDAKYKMLSVILGEHPERDGYKYKIRQKLNKDIDPLVYDLISNNLKLRIDCYSKF